MLPNSISCLGVPNTKWLQDWQQGAQIADFPDTELAAFTYVMECDGRYKIGVTTDVARRLSQIQSANFHHVRIVFWWLTLCANVIEKEWHEFFRAKQIRGEWFILEPDDINLIRRVLQNGGGWPPQN